MGHFLQPRLQIVDTISSPGSATKPNEDRLGHSDQVAFVIDGATGLGDQPVTTGHGSDASWLAEFSSEFLLTHLRDDRLTTEVIAKLISAARDRFLDFCGGASIPRYAWPTASFAMIRLNGDRLEFAGLGDCKALLLKLDGNVEVHSALGDYHTSEAEEASRHLGRLGRFRQGDLLGDPETMASLRAARERQNTPESGIWTLGLVDDAARNICSTTLKASDYTAALLCSDGFASLVDIYQVYTAERFVQAASAIGLTHLCEEIREIECEVDPDGARYPRFKQSDDASALFTKIVT
ncbi:MAG: PP2C family serine/threonine-protein phosphatase [Hoeflea sp.]|uniref:PP2C family serine/threonine-protein phosphatase n=1 Tax=Hoeflea sp. TaxID=1940281 RepID=UPI003EF22FF0